VARSLDLHPNRADLSCSHALALPPRLTRPRLLVAPRAAATRSQATDGIETLRKNVDTLIVIPNDRLLDVVGESTPLQDAFLLADDVLRQVGPCGLSWLAAAAGLLLHRTGLPPSSSTISPPTRPPCSPAPPTHPPPNRACKASPTSSPSPAWSTWTLPT
jgi:hypothetical protein